MPPPNTPEELFDGLDEERLRAANDNSNTASDTESDDSGINSDRENGIAYRYLASRGWIQLYNRMAVSHQNNRRRARSSRTADASDREQKAAAVDYRTLDYVDRYDDNLECPICQCPLVDPVTTECDHVFCRECIVKSTAHSNVCPIDRLPIYTPGPDNDTSFRGVPMILRNQLDNLRVKCPNQRCDHVCDRSLIGKHHDDECAFTKVPCPDTACEKLVPRMRSTTDTCLHREGNCEHCGRRIDMALLEEHLDTECNEQNVRCEHCDAAMPRNEHGPHVSSCPDRRVQCKFSSSGCSFTESKGHFGDHERGCVYGLIVRMNETHQREVEDIRDQLRAAQYRVRRLEMDRIAAEGTRSSEPFEPASADVAPTLDPAGAALSEGRITNALAGLEVFDAKFETLEKYVGEVDARHTHMVMDEVGPLRDQVRELRNQLGPLSMSVRWLLDKALQTSKSNGAAAVRAGDENDANSFKGPQSRSETSDGEAASATTLVARRLSSRGDSPRL